MIETITALSISINFILLVTLMTYKGFYEQKRDDIERHERINKYLQLRLELVSESLDNGRLIPVWEAHAFDSVFETEKEKEIKRFEDGKK